MGYLDEGIVTVHPTADERAHARQTQEDLRRESRERAVVREAATVVAEELLSSVLTEDQRQSWRLNGYFEVIGSHGTLYRLHRGVSGNVEWVRPDGEVGGRLCAHPSMREKWLPTPDVLLAQMLALSTNERAWLAHANVHRGNRPQLVGVS